MVGDWLERADPAAPAIEIAGRTVSYGELDGYADLHGSRLVYEHGLVPGGVAAVAARPTLDAIATMWGAWRTGIIVAPHASERSTVPAGATVVPDRGGEEYPPFFGEPQPIDAAHTLVATSGSTGRPKHAILTRRNVQHAVDASTERLGHARGDRWLLTLPLHHVGGLSILWRSAAVGGCVVVPEDTAPDAVLAALSHCQWASVVPTTLRRLVAALVDGPTWKGASVRGILVGGASCPVELMDEATGIGLPALATYGMTETCSQVATVAPGDADAARGTVGFPLAGYQVDLDADGQIWVMGAGVSPGYWGEAPRSGPFATGDRGAFDTSGRLIVAGRVDEMIITGGENVDPERVEAAIDAHPAVIESAVVGVPDAEWGQRVDAMVVWEGDESIEDLVRHLTARLERWEMPKSYRPVSGVPRTETGKIDRNALRRNRDGS